jgi:signal transduction histidine kinase
VGLVSPEDEAFSAYDKLVRRLGFMLAISSAIAVISVWLYTRRMAQQLAFTYNQLQDMRVSATEKLQTRSRFFQEASHDFKQRLHAMQLLVQAAGRSTHADLPSHLRNLSHTVVSMETYVGDFLEYARLETSVDQPVLKTIHLQSLFQKLELAFEDIALEKNVELKIRVTGFCITTDEKMLPRAVENLMSNSIKFSRGKVLLAARKYPDHLAIEVWDNGTGIPRAQRNRVFDAFYKGSPAYGAYDGVGLGLAIVKRLATALGYALQVNSVEGRSNLVKILIPLDRVAIGSDARA